MKTEQIYEYLERIANLLRTDTRKLGVGKGLQPVQMEALHYLSCCNRYSNTPVAVSDYLGLTKGTVSQTLGVLENAQVDCIVYVQSTNMIHGIVSILYEQCKNLSILFAWCIVVNPTNQNALL